MLSRTFTLGRYTCVERIGASPLGEQWRAKRFGLTGVERLYLALKLPVQLAGETAAGSRLATSAKAYAELEADGLLRLVEHGHQSSDYFVIYEFVGYADLRRLKAGLDLVGASERKDLLPALVAGIGLALSATLAPAHDKGITHGLLAPQAVWIDAQGGVRLADLGLCKTLLKPGWVSDEKAKPWRPYLAPELLSGGEPTPQADVFALGALLGELLGSTATASDIDRALRPILDKAQRKAPAERFADAGALHKELAAISLPMTAEAVRETLAQVGKQFFLVGDAVPQPVVISERSSAEPLPPPPSLRTGKISIGAVPKGVRAAKKDGVSLLGDETSRPPATGSAPREEDTPLPASRPLLLTNPKIAASTGTGAAGPDERPRTPTGENKRTSGQQRTVQSGIDWLTSNGGDGAAPEQVATEGSGPAERRSGQAIGQRPQTRRGVGPVSINPRAQFSNKAPSAPSATTPTQDLDVKMAAATLMREQPDAPAPAAAPAVDVGLYAPLVSGISEPAAERDPYDSLGTGETNPSLAPVRGKRISQPSAAVGDEPTNEVSLADLAAAEADALGKEREPHASSEPPLGSSPAPSSVSGYPDAMSPSGDVLARGLEPSRQKARVPLIAAGVAFFILAAAVAYKLTAGPSTGAGSGLVDAGAADAGKPIDSDTASKAAAAGEVRIESTPQSYVYVDGKPRAKTPTTVQIGPGSHKLLLIASGHKLLRTDITAGAPRKLVLEPALLPAAVAGEQSVKIKCKTKGDGELRVLVDGSDTGLGCPTDDLKVSPGKHTLGFLNPITEVLTEKAIKVKAGKKDTKVKVKVP